MINIGDFAFVGRGEQSMTVQSPRKFSRHGGGRRLPVKAPARVQLLTADEKARLLRIIARATRIHRHAELFELLQSDDVQYFIPHQVMIAAWGDFSGQSLNVDVISAIPGMRTRLPVHCRIDALMRELHARWVAAGRLPLRVDSTMGIESAASACGCALHDLLHGDWSFMVHGMVNGRDGGESLYAALDRGSHASRRGFDRFGGISDALIAQIDVGLRRTAPLRIVESSSNQSLATSQSALSEREEEILRQVAEGKTNGEIAQMLAISAWTVKSHIHRILRKLDVINRLEAVTRYYQIAGQPHGGLPQQGPAVDGVMHSL